MSDDLVQVDTAGRVFQTRKAWSTDAPTEDGEIITGVHRSAMMMDNLGLSVAIEDKSEPPEGA